MEHVRVDQTAVGHGKALADRVLGLDSLLHLRKFHQVHNAVAVKINVCCVVLRNGNFDTLQR